MLKHVKFWFKLYIIKIYINRKHISNYPKSCLNINTHVIDVLDIIYDFTWSAVRDPRFTHTRFHNM
jgi:hypothetical protein